MIIPLYNTHYNTHTPLFSPCKNLMAPLGSAVSPPSILVVGNGKCCLRATQASTANRKNYMIKVFFHFSFGNTEEPRSRGVRSVAAPGGGNGTLSRNIAQIYWSNSINRLPGTKREVKLMKKKFHYEKKQIMKVEMNYWKNWTATNSCYTYIFSVCDCERQHLAGVSPTLRMPVNHTKE